MDRQIIYPGQIPLETDLLNTNKNTMIAIAKLARAMLGTSTTVNGLSVGPNSPAALNVIVQPGEIYSLQNVDGTAYSSLSADTTHQIMKQGVLLDALTLSTPAPGTAGQSINYLIQATFTETDGGSTVLPYYNASNPATAYSGPGGLGSSQNTVRFNTITVSAKAGISATSGTQTTPAPDTGYVGLYVVTVANGQSTVTSANISQLSTAPIIPSGIVPAMQSSAYSYAVDTGTANVYQAAYSPAVTAVTDGMALKFKAKTANTGASTFSPNGLTASPIYSAANIALTGGEIIVNGDVSVIWNSSFNGGSGAWVIQSPAKVATQTQTNTGTDDTTIVTPKKLRFGFSVSLTTSGYVAFPSWLGGVIINWGFVVPPSGENVDATTTFPLAFTSACRGIVITDSASTTNNAVVWANNTVTASTFTSHWSRSGVAPVSTSRAAMFIAIGN